MRDAVRPPEAASTGNLPVSRRAFLQTTGMAAGAALLPNARFLGGVVCGAQVDSDAADYSLHMKASAVEIAPKRIISATTYNGQFPGPLLRFKEGQPVTVDIFNDTDTPEQLHWHGQRVSTYVDGAAEEGTPFIPAHGMRRISFTPGPAGFRFYHTHNRAGGVDYLLQVNWGLEVGCLRPAKNGSFTWTITNKYEGFGFRVLARTPGGTSGTLGPRFSIFKPTPSSAE